MKNIRNSDFARFIGFVAASLCALATFMPPPVQAQTFEQFLQTANATPFGVSAIADDTDTWALIRYIGTGTANSGTVEVEADTDMVFLQGVQGAEAASTELECPVSGALGGIIDVDDAACNTAGEVCDIINDSTSWRCVLLDALRSDVVNDRIVLTSAVRATSVNGVALKWDTSTAFDYSIAMLPPNLRVMSAYLSGRNPVGGGSATPNRVQHNIFGRTQTTFLLGNATNTFGSGTSNLRVYSVAVSNTDSGNSYSETVTELYTEPGGATTVNKVFDDQAVFGGIPSLPGEKMLIRLDNSAAMSAVTIAMFGRFRQTTGR